ncbi:MAG: 50S ribosomal protein L11 methyltransferase [Myxococcota bacterium]
MSGARVDLSPYWRVLPSSPPEPERPGAPILRIAPGQGFGDGSHETTQLCLMAIGYLARTGSRPQRLLDFGAGTGILSIAGALLGARVEAVEIDPRALTEAAENAQLNGVQAAIETRTTLSEPPSSFDLVVANILLPVLLDFAEALAARLSPAGHLVLSGLVATDVPALRARYGPLLPGHAPEIYARGQWRAVVYAPGRSAAQA